MSVHDAMPGDIYIDGDNKLWRVISICHEPTVEVEEVETDENTMPSCEVTSVTAGDLPAVLRSSRLFRRRQGGGVGGLMWASFKRIWENPESRR